MDGPEDTTLFKKDYVYHSAPVKQTESLYVN